jgi:hypothetical protein
MISLLLILASCQSKRTQEPAINISYNSKELKPIYFGDRNNKEKENIEETIKNIMVGKRFIDLPTIDFGEKIEMEALNFDTNEFEIYDYIVDENGNIVSEYNVVPFTITSVDDGKAEFIIEDSEDLDSYRDYRVEGKSIHCLLFRSKINNSSFAFATLVLSNNK